MTMARAASFPKEMREQAKRENKFLVRLQVDGRERKEEDRNGAIEFTGPLGDDKFRPVAELFASIMLDQTGHEPRFGLKDSAGEKKRKLFGLSLGTGLKLSPQELQRLLEALDVYQGDQIRKCCDRDYDDEDFMAGLREKLRKGL
jgi:hypothetical protein